MKRTVTVLLLLLCLPLGGMAAFGVACTDMPSSDVASEYGVHAAHGDTGGADGPAQDDCPCCDGCVSACASGCGQSMSAGKGPVSVGDASASPPTGRIAGILPGPTPPVLIRPPILSC